MCLVWRFRRMTPTEALAGLALELSDGMSRQFERSLARLLPKLATHLESAGGVTEVREVTSEAVAAWLSAPLAGGRHPSLATRHSRRAAARLGFRLLRQAGTVDHDPTVDLDLPPRVRAREARPLTDDEVERGRAAAKASLVETRRPAMWALAEATATTHEIPRVTAADVDIDGGTVRLGGSSPVDARVGALNDWAAQSLALHLDTVASVEVPLVYAGSGRSEAAMQAAASATLSKILIAARLRSDPAVKPASVRAWAGRRVFVETGRIEEAALALGCRTLDTAAAIIGLDWRDQP